MKKRLVCLSTAAIVVLSTAACSDDTGHTNNASSEETATSTTSGSSASTTSSATSLAGGEGERDTKDEKKRPNPTAPNETALEGTLQIAHFKDMTPPDVYENVKDALDTDTEFYAIKLDQEQAVTAKTGSNVNTQNVTWAILGSSRNAGDAHWKAHLGHRIRVIAHQDQMNHATDISSPPLAVTVEDYSYKPEILD